MFMEFRFFNGIGVGRLAFAWPLPGPNGLHGGGGGVGEGGGGIKDTKNLIVTFTRKTN